MRQSHDNVENNICESSGCFVMNSGLKKHDQSSTPGRTPLVIFEPANIFKFALVIDFSHLTLQNELFLNNKK